LIKRLIGVADVNKIDFNISKQTVFITEIPFPGALCIPQYLRAIVALDRTIEEILENYDDRLRRSLLKNRKRYCLKQTTDEAVIDYVDRQMLQPFAAARHGTSANQMSSETVRRFALEFGRLDLVLLDEKVVGCMLGVESIRRGKRYWVADRCGYPETVFSNPRLLSELNSINHHLTIEWAINNGFDYCDFALCFARPDDGLIQFKRSRGAALDTIGLQGYGHFYVNLPKTGTAEFLWTTPLFAVEGKDLTLHLGLPTNASAEEFITRYRQMGFVGLKKIYLHYARLPEVTLLDSLSKFYKHHKIAPTLTCIPVN
jgi:hypothetical protein